MTLQKLLTSTTIEIVLFVHIVVLRSYQHHSGHAHDHEKTAGFLNRQDLVPYYVFICFYICHCDKSYCFNSMHVIFFLLSADFF